MKLTFLLVCSSLLAFSAATYSQNTKLNLSAKNSSLIEVFRQIEDHSEYYFYFNKEDVKSKESVSIELKDVLLNEILDQVLANTGLEYKIIDRYVVVKQTGAADPAIAIQQKRTISGKVTDATGATLPGVSVVVKGTTTGVITDNEGQYSLQNIPDNGTMVFSFVGMKSQEIVVGNKTTINVSLTEETVGIEEVVAIGYGTMKKSDLTGAVVHADLKALENSLNVSVLQGVKGVVPGLNIGVATKAGDDPSISIRGRNSISGTTQPLIVLDGIVYRGSITDINPSDIESIDVLKDASSAAIYGSQAANGVLMITTKSVKKMSKPTIEYNGSFAVQQLINGNMGRLDREGFLNQLADVMIPESRMGPDLLQKNPNFDVTKLFRDEKLIPGYQNETNVDWYKLMSVPTPYIQNHSLSLRGKSELSSYFLSFGYTDQKNIIKKDTYERYNVRVNIDAKVTEWLKIGTQSFFTLNDMSGNNPTFSTICEIPALAAAYDDAGNLITIPYRAFANPLLSINNPDSNKRYNLTGNFYADVTIPFIKGLSYRLNYSNNLTMDKLFTFDPYANAQLGQARKLNSSQNNWTLDNILTYKRTFGKHAFNGTLVYGVEKRSYESTDAISKNFTNPTLGYNYTTAGQANLNTVTSAAWEESSLYAMARGGYTFNDRYIFTATIRRDGFSGFGLNNKIGYFPSAAAAWKISEESFFKDNVKWVDNLKLRASFGSNGNRTGGRYATLAQMTTKMPFSGGYSQIEGGYIFGDGATPELTQALNTMLNSDLKWETTTSLNIGVDFTLLKNRIFGSYEYYNSSTSNLLYNISIPSMNGMFPDGSGNLNVPTNIGKLTNTGHEVSLTGIPIRNNDFEWKVTGNFSINKNRVISILGLDLNKDGKEDDLISSNIFIGKPLGVVYDYSINGMWQVADYNNKVIPSGFTYGTYKIEDINGDGKYSADFDRKILGYTEPLYRLSLQNDIRYKDFELKLFVNSIQGGSDNYLGHPLGSLPIPDGLSNSSYFKFDYWTPENPNAKYRQLGFYTQAVGSGFSPYVQRNFIRLQEVSLSYNIPAKILKKVNINRLRLFISGTNLLTITKWDGWDPEANQGVTYALGGGYPTMKNYSFGVNFEF